MAVIDALSVEEAVISCLLKNPACADVVRTRIGLDDFSSPLLANCYRAIAQVVKGGGLPEPTAIGNIVAGMQGVRDTEQTDFLVAHVYNMQYVNTANPVNAALYADKVRDFALSRQMEAVSHLILSGLKDKQSPIELAGDVQNALSKVRPRALHLWRTAEQVADIVVDRAVIAAQNPGSITGLRTPFSDLTYVTQGFQKGEMYVFGARPGMGKTALVLRLVLDAAKQGKSVLFSSLEMSGEQVISRLLCGMARTSVTALRRGELGSEDFERLSAAKDALNGLPIYVDDKRETTTAEILLKAHEVKRIHGEIGLVAIDYLQIIKPSLKGDRHLQVGQIARDLKSLALELNCPVIVLAQVGRGVESRKDRRPALSDLRESGEIEAEADVVCFLYRDEYYADHNVRSGAHQEKAEIIVAKNRNGETGTVDVAFNAAFTWFDDLAKDVESSALVNRRATHNFSVDAESKTDLIDDSDAVDDFFDFGDSDEESDVK